MSKQGFIAVGGVSNSHREEFEAKVLEFKTPEMEREVMRRRHQVTELSNQNIKESLRTVNGYNVRPPSCIQIMSWPIPLHAHCNNRTDVI